MKEIISIFAASALLALLLALPVVSTGCKTTSTVTNGVTNVTTTLDPVKVQQIQDAVQPVLSSGLRRAIARSPDHAVEIGNYARALGSVFSKMDANSNFTPLYLVDAANAATASLQTGVNQDIIDIKDVVVAVYKVAYGSQPTWPLPSNVWMKAVAATICSSINQALIDSGQVGCK